MYVCVYIYTYRASNPTDSSVISTFQLRTTEIGLIYYGSGHYLDSSSSESSSGPAAKKKCQAGGKFKVSWKLPVGITASSKGAEYAHCKLCMRDFSIAHGGFNDITRHIKGPIHQQRFNDSSSTILKV